MLWNGQSLLSQTHKKPCNSFFIRSKFHPNSPHDFTTQTANPLLLPLPEWCFPPYVTLYENASAVGCLHYLLSLSNMGQDIILGLNQGPGSDWKARKCGLAGHSINLYPQNGIKRLFWSQGTGNSTDMSIIPWERGSLCLNQEMFIFALSHARRCHSYFHVPDRSLSRKASYRLKIPFSSSIHSFDVKIFRSNSCVGG